MTHRTAHEWIKDHDDPKLRSWEEFYRNRWQHDKVVRSTHGVNCTGSCSWNIYVKNGIVTWEMQALDYPTLDSAIPPYEPRGCQRGISYSWYLYSPLRVRYPYIRGALLDLWRTARERHGDPVRAWAALVGDPAARSSWQQARGKGGFRRCDWDTANEIIAASMVHTTKKHGPDRIAGFSPIPAMSMISYAAGARLMQLVGGISLSFYDWYCDLPSASPETWGEQTDVHESADWFNAKLLAVMGANLNMTRTPDCHFAAEARHNGSKMWVFSPDFNQVAKFADEWVPIHAGQDGAWWMAVVHVLLSEFHHARQVPAFLDYTKRFTDAPFLVELTASGDSWRPGQLLRPNRLAGGRYAAIENPDWQFLMWDAASDAVRVPYGAVGTRWAKEKGRWNLQLKDLADGSAIDPVLTFVGRNDGVVATVFDDFAAGQERLRGVPVRRLQGVDGREITVATVYDVLMAQYGVERGLGGAYPTSYDDAEAPYTPAWSERLTGMDRKAVIRFAREWGKTAELTGGKCTIIIGAGINHWYHANLIYRAGMHALMFTGCVGVNGGGLAHYVGQEKLAPGESWGAIAFAKDWVPASRLQNGTSWHYVNTDQWRYEKSFTDYHTVPIHQPPGSLAHGHTMDLQVRAVRSGWMPFYPQFASNPLDVVKEAEAAGATTPEAVVGEVVRRLKDGSLRFSVEDPDAEANWPRVWIIWRGNAIGTSAKGHEYFLKHYLGTHTNAVASDDFAKDQAKEVVWHEKAPTGKMDLVVDLNFRMDTSAMYSDIVLPAASWYEKADLNSTDMHSFIHPLSAAVPPCWESKSDWQIFKGIARSFSAISAREFPQPVRDVVATPLAHDSPAEISQAAMLDWKTGECEAIPGKTMPGFRIVTRDYANVFNQYCSFGPLARANGLGAHGTHYGIEDEYDRILREKPPYRFDGKSYPSLAEDELVCDVILRCATVTNGELAYRSYRDMEERTGVPLVHLAEKSRNVRVTYKDLQAKPMRLLNSPMWSGLTENGRPYAPFTYNVETGVPWRTLTGRQHFYLDHPGYIQFGEHVPTYKPRPIPTQYADLAFSKEGGRTKMLNLLTPHGKWHIHSTYGDNQRMTTLSRGIDPFWLSEEDARELDIADNDWVEVTNDHGVVVTRANISARIPRGVCIIYHATERTVGVPLSPGRGNKRAGMNNSLTRTRMKPNLLFGGYGQFTYHFNYWGPIGCNRDTHILVRKLPGVNW
jgi:nitrate reductase / nitrite oxidoreductase, alpha subunit